LIFEVSSGDSQGSGIFQHTDSTDRYWHFLFLFDTWRLSH
jgi:hypothetical protein